MRCLPDCLHLAQNLAHILSALRDAVHADGIHAASGNAHAYAQAPEQHSLASLQMQQQMADGRKARGEERRPERDGV
jgi:hypothetical protein